MGNDGGSIARRDELVRTKGAVEKADPDSLRLATWSLCALSRQPLRSPIVSCPLGRLYNKDALLHYLLSRSTRQQGGADDVTAGHIRGLKDVVQLRLTNNPAWRNTIAAPASAETKTARGQEDEVVPFQCPLTAKPMNGKSRFVYLVPCGCVLSESALKAITYEGKKRKPSSPPSTTSAGNENAPQPQPQSAGEDTTPCPLCGVGFRGDNLVKSQKPTTVGGGSDVIPLNPAAEEEAILRATMIASRAAATSKASSSSRKKAAALSTSTETETERKDEEEEEAAQTLKRQRKETKRAARRQAQILALRSELSLDGSGNDNVVDEEEDEAALTPSAKRAKLEAVRPSMSDGAPGVEAARRVAMITRQRNGPPTTTTTTAVKGDVASYHVKGQRREGDKEAWLNRGT